MAKISGIYTMGGNPISLLGEQVKVGDRAKDFTVLKADLSPFSLGDMGGGIKVLSVVPSLDTGVCELQTINFNERATEFDSVNIYSISVDLPFAQKRFCSANNIDKLTTLSDHRDLSFGMNYGFVIEEFRLLNRGIVILDNDNIVRYVEYVKEVSDHPDYDKAIEALKELL